MRMVHVSDVHFGREDPVSLKAFDDHLAEFPADVIIVSGDLTQHGRRREFRMASHWVAGLGTPVITTPGNHDAPSLNLVSRFTGPFRRYRRAFESGTPFVHTDVAIIPLRTAQGFQWRRDWSLGAVRNRDLANALHLLADASAARWRIVVCHHPLVDVAETRVKGRTRGGRAALEALAAAGADFVLTGHTHTPFVRFHPDGASRVCLVGAGTLSDRVREAPASFNRLTTPDDGLTLDSYALRQGVFHREARHCFHRTSFPEDLA